MNLALRSTLPCGTQASSAMRSLFSHMHSKEKDGKKARRKRDWDEAFHHGKNRWAGSLGRPQVSN
jgi:hypothetical protein